MSFARIEISTNFTPQTLAIQLGIKEAIVPTGTASGGTDRDFDLKKLKDVLDRCGIVITERKPSKYMRTDYTSCFQRRIFRRIFGKDGRGGPHSSLSTFNGYQHHRGFNCDSYAILLTVLLR